MPISFFYELLALLDHECSSSIKQPSSYLRVKFGYLLSPKLIARANNGPSLTTKTECLKPDIVINAALLRKTLLKPLNAH